MLDWLDRRVAIVFAHPDDETIGAGAQFTNLKAPMLIQVTDGAPRTLGPGREDYARARRDELTDALKTGGARSIHRREIGLVDQEASLNLPELTARLAELFREGRPEVVLTHPYEGGHPDHDATALAVNSAVEALKREKIPVPLLLEFTSYHAGKASEMITGEFLPCEDRRETAIVLTGEARRRKREMIQCFVTQRDVLRHFPVVYERFRYAPAYDFTEPPHRGELFYERFNWGITGERWRDLARKALRSQARITL